MVEVAKAPAIDANPNELEKARALFKAFQYRYPREGELILLGGLDKPAVMFEVGNVLGLSYKALGNGADYYHDFSAPLPRLFCNAQGDQVFLVGGGYRFSARGFLK
jgi:hypothetical protein